MFQSLKDFIIFWLLFSSGFKVTLMKNQKELKEGVAMVCTHFNLGLHKILDIQWILVHIVTFEFTHLCGNQYI